MAEKTYAVTGMTCEHCVRSVTEEVEKIDGVSRVEVDLATGAVTVMSDTALHPEDVRAAIGEAGYEFAAG
jgi:copper ion binding protein